MGWFNNLTTNLAPLALPGIGGLLGGAAGGTAGIIGLGALGTYKQNQAARSTKRDLESEAAALRGIVAPIESSLEAGYAPGGWYQTLATSVGMEDAAIADAMERAGRTRQAIRTGGIRSGALLAPQSRWARSAAQAPIAAQAETAARRLGLATTRAGAAYNAVPTQYNFRNPYAGWLGLINAAGSAYNAAAPYRSPAAEVPYSYGYM